MKIFFNLFFNFIVCIFCFQKKFNRNILNTLTTNNLIKKKRKKKRKKFKGNEILLSANFSLSHIGKNTSKKKLFSLKKKKKILNLKKKDKIYQFLNKNITKVHPDVNNFLIKSKILNFNKNKNYVHNLSNEDSNKHENIFKTAKLDLFKKSDTFLNKFNNKKRTIDLNDSFKTSSLSFLNYLALAIIIFLLIIQLLSIIFPTQRKKIKKKLKIKPENFFKKHDYLKKLKKEASNILKAKKNYKLKKNYKNLSEISLESSKLLLPKKKLNKNYVYKKAKNVNKTDFINETKVENDTEIKNETKNLSRDRNKDDFSKDKLRKENLKNFKETKTFEKLNADKNSEDQNKTLKGLEFKNQFKSELDIEKKIKVDKEAKIEKKTENVTNLNIQTKNQDDLKFEEQKILNEKLNTKLDDEFNSQSNLSNNSKKFPTTELIPLIEKKDNLDIKLQSVNENKISKYEDETKITEFKVQNEDLSYKKDKLHKPEEMKLSFKEEKIINMVDNKNLNDVSDKVISSSNEQKIGFDFDSKLNDCTKLNDNEMFLKSNLDNKIFPNKQLTEIYKLDDNIRFENKDNQIVINKNLIKKDLNENIEKADLNKNLFTKFDLNKIIRKDTKQNYSENDLNKNELEKDKLIENDLMKRLKKFKKTENDSKFNSTTTKDLFSKKIVNENNKEKNTFTKIPISWKIEVNGKNKISEETIDLEKNEDYNLFRLKLPSAIFDLQNQSDKN